MKTEYPNVHLISEYGGFEIYRVGEPGDYSYIHHVMIGDESYWSDFFCDYQAKRIPGKLTCDTWRNRLRGL